jgi:hypothetical protein
VVGVTRISPAVHSAVSAATRSGSGWSRSREVSRGNRENARELEPSRLLGDASTRKRTPRRIEGSAKRQHVEAGRRSRRQSGRGNVRDGSRRRSEWRRGSPSDRLRQPGTTGIRRLRSRIETPSPIAAR